MNTPTLTVPEAAEMLGISEWQTYALIKRDEFPTPVLRLGRVIRIPRQPLLETLGIAEPPGAH
jgi:excisionase family DNA binding protein